MKRVFVFSMMAVMALLVVGCCACRKGKNAKPLVGTQWHLVRMMERDLKIAPDQFVFTFNAEGRFAGKGACNRMMGGYTTTDKGEMKFSGVASTRMMCPDVDLEGELGQILDKTTHYEIDGDMLMLLSNGELQAVFQATEASADEAAAE
ncbi:MAG: META domain-containing protein [Alistipes sp.]|nr:META domain-containing protein [Alistipes sp.]